MSYVPRYTINEKNRNNLQDIERLKDKIRGSRILPEVEASIRLRASVESVHSSTSIEGNPLSANEVRAVISTDKILTKEEYAEIEVQNYKNALDYIDKRRHGSSEISLGDILELHRIITDRLLGKTRNGKIRKNPVYIENQDHEILYTAVEADRIESALIELLSWVRESQFSIHPVIIAAVIHFRIAAIHPFSDGNGRTARAVTSLFLALNQYDCNGSLVLDSYYASDRKAYYAILQLLNGRNYAFSVKSDLTPWLEYFTDGFLTSLHVLDAEIRMLNVAITGKDVAKLDREDQDIIGYVSKFGSISISEAEEILPEVSRRSLQRRLKDLVDGGLLELVGETHEARYVLGSKN
ncbi:MAG: Fic family protein [Candidatus Saccharibacteria bacterium]|nr:Fic family protein [Candidatus Saccharibacteria bacterium]